jgi:arginine deiminase
MAEILNLNIQSEIGELEGVILHTPGEEVENMTPGTAQRALYSDILNLSIARTEYEQLQGVLGKYTRTFQVAELLEAVLDNYSQREALIKKVCDTEGALE